MSEFFLVLLSILLTVAGIVILFMTKMISILAKQYVELHNHPCEYIENKSWVRTTPVRDCIVCKRTEAVR